MPPAQITQIRALGKDVGSNQNPAPIGSARSYLTLSTLATVLQLCEDHPHHRLTMPLQHGSLFLRWPCCPVRRPYAGGV